MAAIIEGVLNWFAREYFSDEFSGGDALSLVVLVLLGFVLLTRRPSNIYQTINVLRGDVGQMKGKMQTLDGLQGDVGEIKGKVDTLVKILKPPVN